jgi:hypothetical protein
MSMPKNGHRLPHWFNPLTAELNLIRHLLALVGAHHILHVSRVRVNFKRLFKLRIDEDAKCKSNLAEIGWMLFQ